MELGVDSSALQTAAEAACRAALRRGLGEVDARDLAQDALVRALSSARPPAGVPLAAWVYGIANNLGRDRAKAARSREISVDVVPELVAAADDPTTVLAVRRAVHELPEPLRDVITLHELEEHSLRETAEALAIPFDTAKDRLRRAREQLREQLGDSEAACASERTHSRRRAAGQGAAIVAGVWAALAARSASAASAAAGASVAAARGLVVRGWIAAVAAGALVTGGFVAGRLTASSPPPMTAASAPVAIAAPVAPPPPIAPVAITAPAPPAAAPVHRAPAAAVPPPAPAITPEHAAERLTIDRARSALQRGMADEALVALMSHLRQFPNGELAEERDVLLIEAYQRADNAQLAQRWIERYRADYPTGALRARVDELASASPDVKP